MTNSRIEKDFYFRAAVHFENKFYVNAYNITASFFVETSSVHEQYVAMERMKYFINECLADSMFIHATDVDAIQKYHIAGIKICDMPDEPHDQIVAMTILQKLNSITEGKVEVTDVVVASDMSDGARYSIVHEITETLLCGNFWWNKSDTSICNEDQNSWNNDNVIALFSDNGWIELGLSWKEYGK